MGPQAGQQNASAQTPRPAANGHEPVAQAIGPDTNQRGVDSRAIEAEGNGHAFVAGAADPEATRRGLDREPAEHTADGHGSIGGSADLGGKEKEVEKKAIKPKATGPASVTDTVDAEVDGTESVAGPVNLETQEQEVDSKSIKPEGHGPEPIATAVGPAADYRKVEPIEAAASGHDSAPHPDESASNEADGGTEETELASNGFVDLINEALSPRQTLPGFADPRVEHVNSIELPPWFIDRCRQAYLSVRFDPSAPCRVVGVTSGSYGEGKTSVAIGTAIAMAVDTNKPTLLIECDFAEPTFYRFFGIERGRGLGDWLDGGARLRIVRGAALVPNVFVIPSGSPQSEPARFLFELIDREVMDGLRSCFGNVVIDLPPALNISYGSLAFALADHLLIVARSGMTPTEDLERLVNLIGKDRVSGIVLNGTDTRTPRWLRHLL